MTEGRATIRTAGAPPQKTDMKNKNGLPGVEITQITATQTTSAPEEGTMTAGTHEVGTEKNAEREKEIRIGNGPGNPHPLEEGARNEQESRVLLRRSLP